VTVHRRVVVGHDANGSSFVAADETVDELVLAPRGHRLAMLWGRDDVADLPAPVEDRLPAGFIPPAGGWRASLLTFAPDDTPLLAEGEGVGLLDLGAQMAKGGGRGMHTTPTVDVALLVSGELWLEVDDGTEVRLVSGDAVVQNGTRHGWRNRSGVPATLALFMVGAHHSHA
jgi:hypothetical protein